MKPAQVNKSQIFSAKVHLLNFNFVNVFKFWLNNTARLRQV